LLTRRRFEHGVLIDGCAHERQERTMEHQPVEARQRTGDE
jgi:hypothetical protein